MRHARSLISGLAIGCACAAGCQPLTPPALTSELRVVAGSRESSAPASAFHAEVWEFGLTSAPGRRPPFNSLQARVTLELRGDRFEYHIRLRNPDAELITGAFLTTVGAGGRAESPVVVLFTDGGLRDRFIELRGTASVVASTRASVLVEELQSRPVGFAITLRGADERAVWSGRLLEGR
ncbi:MAG: hypothetical protein ACT4P7_20350 [Gemmatimonadaceae bacterium]